MESCKSRGILELDLVDFFIILCIRERYFKDKYMKLLFKSALKKENPAKFVFNTINHVTDGGRILEEVAEKDVNNTKISPYVIPGIINKDLQKVLKVLKKTAEESGISKVNLMELVRKEVSREILMDNEELKEKVVAVVKIFFENYISHRKFRRHNDKGPSYFREVEERVLNFFENYKKDLGSFISELVESEMGLDREKKPIREYIAIWEDGKIFSVLENSMFHEYYTEVGSFLIKNDEKVSKENNINNFLKRLNIDNGFDKEGKNTKTKYIAEIMKMLEEIIE